LLTVSGGAIEPSAGYRKITGLLDSYHHQGIPVGINHAVKGINFPIPLNYSWGNESGIIVPETSNYTEVIENVLDQEPADISFISLGSLNTINGFLHSSPGYRTRISRIIWSNSGSSGEEGFNFAADRISAEEVLGGDIQVSIVGPAADFDLYSREFIPMINEIGTRYAHSISESFRKAGSGDHKFLMEGSDEFLPLFLHYPELFITDSPGLVTFSIPSDQEPVRYAMLRILKGETVNQNQVIEKIPADTSFYMTDLRPYIDEIISTHGIEEFTSSILANELHRHLGVYSVIGVKMGILAREYFHITNVM